MFVMYCDLHAWFSFSMYIYSVICTQLFNMLALLYNGHIALIYTAHFVYSSLNSYLYIHVLDPGYILLILNDALTVYHYKKNKKTGQINKGHTSGKLLGKSICNKTLF